MARITPRHFFYAPEPYYADFRLANISRNCEPPFRVSATTARYFHRNAANKPNKAKIDPQRFINSKALSTFRGENGCTIVINSADVANV